MKVEKFEDLVAWQKARELTKQIYEITKQGAFSKDYGLCDQIRRATVSVMSNLAEGFERGSSSEFHHKKSIRRCHQISRRSIPHNRRIKNSSQKAQQFLTSYSFLSSTHCSLL